MGPSRLECFTASSLDLPPRLRRHRGIGGAMTTRIVDDAAVRQWALRAAADSARLERREVPAGHVRSEKVEKFLESIRSKA